MNRLHPLRSVRAGALEIAYFEAGPPEGPPVFPMHGFPCDVHSYMDVAPALAAQGCRVIVPYLRGYGPTRFLRADTRTASPERTPRPLPRSECIGADVSRGPRSASVSGSA